jgi:hypothetical protein
LLVHLQVTVDGGRDKGVGLVGQGADRAQKRE